MLRWQNGRLDSKGDKLGVRPQFQAQKASRPSYCKAQLAK